MQCGFEDFATRLRVVAGLWALCSLQLLCHVSPSRFQAGGDGCSPRLYQEPESQLGGVYLPWDAVPSTQTHHPCTTVCTAFPRPLYRP